MTSRMVRVVATSTMVAAVLGACATTAPPERPWDAKPPTTTTTTNPNLSPGEARALTGWVEIEGGNHRDTSVRTVSVEGSCFAELRSNGKVQWEPVVCPVHE